MKTRWIAGMLCLILLLSSLIGCAAGGKENPSSDTTTAPADPAVTPPAAVSDTAEVTTGKYDRHDSLPEDLNFENKSVRFLYREEIVDEFYVDEISGDLIEDAIYRSISETEERLNVDIVVYTQPGHYTDVRSSYNKYIENSVLANDNAYDWVDMMIALAPGVITKGLFLDLAEQMYLDTAQPWYIADMDETVAIDGKLYFISGDASIGYLKNTFCMYFNTKMIDTYSLEDPYALVDSGKWTMDKLSEMIATVKEDLNGDGVITKDDRLGLIIHDQNHAYGFMASTGMRAFTQNAEGVWEYILGSERDAQISESVYQLFMKTEGSYFFNSTDSATGAVSAYAELTAKFLNGEDLFITAQMNDAIDHFRNMSDPYGVLPLPKLNEEQEGYSTTSRSIHNCFAILNTCTDPDMASATLEALASSNYRNVLPTYFEEAMKLKYSSSDNASRMFDLIHDNFTLDFGYIFNIALGQSPLSAFYDTVRASGGFASQVAANKKVVAKKLEKYLDSLAAAYQ